MPFRTMYSIDFYDLCQMASLRSLAKETLIYGMSYSLGRLINFLLVTNFLTSVFSENRAYFSIYTEIYFLIALFLGILGLRMETTFFRFVSDDETKSKIYPLASQLVFLACFIFITAVYLFINPIEAVLNYPELRTHIYLAAWICILDVISALPFSKIRYQKQALRYAWIKLSTILLNVVLVIGIVSYFGGSPATQLKYVLLANLIASAVSFIFLFPEIKESFQKADWSLAKNVLRYASPLVIVSFSFIIIQYGASSLLKYFLPGSILENLDQSSTYNAAARLAVIMNLFVTAFNYAAEPFFFRHKHTEHSRADFARLSLYFVISCSFVYLFTVLYRDLFAYLLDKNFRSELFLINILLLANIFAGIYSNFSSWYKLADKNYLAAWISFAGMLLMIVLNIILIPYLGNASAAYANLACYLFICALSYFQGQKYFPIPYKMWKMSCYLLVCIFISIVIPMIYTFLDLSFWFRQLGSLFILILFIVLVYFLEYKRNTISNDHRPMAIDQ